MPKRSAFDAQKSAGSFILTVFNEYRDEGCIRVEGENVCVAFNRNRGIQPVNSDGLT